MSARASARTARKPPVDFDSDDIDNGDEPVETTTGRARRGRAKQSGMGVRVAMHAAPNRGARAGRNVRSNDDRGHNGRTANSRTIEFTEEEIRNFASEEENLLPHVPDTKDWHYKWTRVKIGVDGKDDGSNITANLNGKMGYEVVTGPDMLPKGCSLKALTIKDGDYSGGYQFRDAMLMRCPMRNFKLAKIVAQRRTKALDEMLDVGAQAAALQGEQRTGIVVEENYERHGIREVEPAEEGETA